MRATQPRQVMAGNYTVDPRTVLHRILAALGMTLAEFELERARFDLSAEEWLAARLRALGWERK